MIEGIGRMADTLKRQNIARFHMTKNGQTLYDQRYDSETTDYTESSHTRAVLATNMTNPSEIDIEGVDTAKAWMLTTSQTVYVAIDDNSFLWPVKEFVMVVGAVTHLYVKNTNTTNTATVEIVVTD